MSRKRNVLHSTERHNNRNYKRRIRNLVFEITFIIILVVVATKFIKKGDEIPEVKRLSEEQQKELIDKELQENNNTQVDKEEIKELEILTPNQSELIISKVTINYVENQTIVTFSVKNNSDIEVSARFFVEFLNEEEKKIDGTYVDVPVLQGQNQTKVNIVVKKDLRDAKKIKVIDEK